MGYVDILNDYKGDLPKERQWWPDYFYHFTDVHNAVSIIESGWIYSRTQAQAKDIMVNDNASRVVIDMTGDEKKTYGRLYFRPLTPTQYHNEGYKPESVRKREINASCPVPVFFLLSVGKTMRLDNVRFAEKGIAGGRNDIQQGELAFSRLNLKKIYHDGPYSIQEEADIVQYRQSEIIREGGFPLPQIIRGIVCRSNAERETLFYLLRRKSEKIYNAYKKLIMYAPSKRMFYNNGIFIKEVSVTDRVLNLELNSKQTRIHRGDNPVLFEVYISITYLSMYGSQLCITEGRAKMNYCTVEKISMKLKKDLEYSGIIIKVMFDDAVMYENEISLTASTIW